MKESPFAETFESAAWQVCGPDIIVAKKANLLYELYLTPELKLAIKETTKPRRGYSAFQTDMCIFERRGSVDIPRVVIEFKTEISTHDILTYSAKAGRHKEIYPWLRYGMICEAEITIPSRFFIHNEHLDFCIAAKNHTGDSALQNCAKTLIEGELETSRTLERIHFDGKRVDYFRREIHFRDLQSGK